MLLRSIGAAVRRHHKKVGANQAVLTSPRKTDQWDGPTAETSPQRRLTRIVGVTKLHRRRIATLVWTRRRARTCRRQVEVRPFVEAPSG
jgi:hypothetical protein